MAAGYIGKQRWVIAEGYIPPDNTEIKDPTLRSHETACMLNAGDIDANVVLTVFFVDREPAGPYRVIVPARRTVHLRLDKLTEPEAIPRATPYASLIEADVPIVVQHTRLDSRQDALALMSTIAFGAD